MYFYLSLTFYARLPSNNIHTQKIQPPYFVGSRLSLLGFCSWPPKDPEKGPSRVQVHVAWIPQEATGYMSILSR